MSFALQLLGTVQVTWDTQPLKFATEHTRALLAYLAVEADVAHRRTRLATLLWPEEDEATARHNLRQALFFLKQSLAVVPAWEKLLQITATTVQWHSQAVTVDLRAFQARWRQSQTHDHPPAQLCAACVEELTQAVALYGGEFLQGLLLKDNPLFEEWVLLLREQSHRQALTMLNALTTHYAATSTYDQMAHYAARQVALEPWHEEGHRQLMQALAAQGQQSAALRQYEKCRQILQQELGAPPSAETTRLYEQIRTGAFAKVTGSGGDKVSDRTVTLSPPDPVTPARLHNLPVHLSPLVGRSQQLAQLRTLLRTPGQRLLTLVGMGGMGKSRLALAFMEQLAVETPPPFADGVWFISLIGVATNGDNLPEALAGVVFDVPDNPTAADYPAGRREVANLVSALYQYMLIMTESIFLQPPEHQKLYFNQALHRSMIWILDKLLQQMRQVSLQPTNASPSSVRLAPTFENVDIGPRNKAFATLVSICRNLDARYGNAPWYTTGLQYYVQMIPSLPDVSALWATPGAAGAPGCDVSKYQGIPKFPKYPPATVGE
ncbi:MAG: hypothetical protein DYG89_43540, partial [Caldilinea sp. CFX5]|nr:hypothetical protein [Caldilinea sp. CFX5]